jgi:hypothetical protein
VAIYEEWRASTHAAAWLGDPQFQAELAKSRQDGDVAWMCVNCHTPQWSQLPRVVADLRGKRLDAPRYVDNPDYVGDSEEDAVSCAACHVRDGVVEGPWGTTAAPHPVRRSERLLGEAVCTECHQAAASFPDLNLACMFNTGAEWRDGPYDEAGQPCSHCHMPERQEPVAHGAPIRTRRVHQFGGSMLAKTPEHEALLAPYRDLYPEGMEVRWLDLPATVPAGQPFVAGVEYVNRRAGHLLPTGDPERALLLDLRAYDDGTGEVIGASSVSIGTVVTWWPEVRVESDNRLRPGEGRRLELHATAPPAGAVRIELRVTKRRISPENLDHHGLRGRTLASRVTVNLDARIPVRPEEPQRAPR